MSNHHVLHFSTSTPPMPLFPGEHVAGIDGIIGGTTVLKGVLDRVRRVAPTDLPRQWDKLKALELIAKLRGMLVDKHEHQVVAPRPVIHVHEHVGG